MKKNWDLSPLYSGFDSDLLQNDLNTMNEMAKELTEKVSLLNASSAEFPLALLTIFKKMDHLTDLLLNLYNYGSLTFSVDTKNNDASKLVEQIEDFFPTLTLIETRLMYVLKDIKDLENLYAAEEGLREYQFTISTSIKKAQYLLSEEEEVMLAKMQNTGSAAWAKLQSNIVSSLTSEYEGKEETITVLRAKAHDPNPAVRKSAFEAELSAYPKKETESAACLNAIKGEVITVSNLRGYSSPLEMTLLSSRMDRETLDAMMESIKEFLPVFRSYLKKKADLLQHKNGLPFYDLFAPIGNVNLSYTYDEARDFIVKQFNTFSTRLGSYAQNAFDKNWIDPFPREGKVAGAFCSNIHGIKESRIMSNFVGSFSDMTTLAHELGHGYHGECLKDVTTANSDYPMPLAETASIFCETIVFQAALENANPDEALVILENDLQGSTQVIVDIYSRYLFETALFEKRKEASLSVEELKELMLKAQQDAYGEGLDPTQLHPYMWMCKPHYYYSDSNFYNFPYAFGLLFAKGLYAQYQKDKDAFIPKYDQLLTSTGCHTIHEVLETLGINSHKKDFFVQSLQLIQEDIEKFLGLA